MSMWQGESSPPPAAIPCSDHAPSWAGLEAAQTRCSLLAPRAEGRAVQARRGRSWRDRGAMGAGRLMNGLNGDRQLSAWGAK